MGRAVSFAADVQTGISLNHDDRNVCGFYCSPNIGLSFKTGKCGALDLMFGYRYELLKGFGIRIGYRF